MKTQTMKTLGGVMSAMALVSGGAGMAAIAPIQSAEAAPQATVAATEAQEVIAVVKAVEGTFSFTQNAVTSNETISNVFSKAAATLCASLPTYSADSAKVALLSVSTPDASFEATVADAAASEGSTSYMMACSCATNVAGGGAIANAEVEGVSLETLMKMGLV